MRPSRLPFVTCLTALCLAGCGSPREVAPETEPTAAAGQGVAATPVATGAAAAGSATQWNGGALQALDIQSAHPNGVVLQLTSLQSRATETAIGVRVMNGRDREINLNRFNTRNGYIVLDTGERLYLSPPANNARISIPAGQTLEGELVFLGRLPPAQSAVLILNENAATDNEHTTSPGFRIDLPLQGLGS
jgi:hypothetical protein